MRVLIAAAVMLATVGAARAQDVYHRGYTTQQGTYVQPHYQTRPDGNPFNNYSTQGNINPYTGQPGTVNPYAAQQRNQYMPAPNPYLGPQQVPGPPQIPGPPGFGF